MKISYDPKVDAMYIKLAKGKYDSTRKISDVILVDEDRGGKVLGIEILDASETVPSFNPKDNISLQTL